MAVAAAIPLIASLIPAIGGIFGGGDKGGSKGGDAASQAALGTALASKDLPPVLAATMNKSGHVLPHAATASGKMGHRGVLHPHLEAALAATHTKQQTAPILRHQEQAARASVKRVNESVAPQLHALAKGMRDRAVQVQATAEHRALVQRDQRWRRVADQQQAIIRKLDDLERKIQRRYWHA